MIWSGTRPTPFGEGGFLFVVILYRAFDGNNLTLVKHSWIAYVLVLCLQ